MDRSLEPEELRTLNAYWRACNYLCVGMIYLRANPLLREPLKPEHIKRRLLGHWGSDPGQSFIWVHLNRLIKKYDLNTIYISGPGHGAPATLANAYLEGHLLRDLSRQQQDEAGLLQVLPAVLLSRRHRQPLHARDARLHPRRRRARLQPVPRLRSGLRQPRPHRHLLVGDGEAETGPLATSWHSNKFLNPIRDGAVLPILHLNGYKIANPTILARIPAKSSSGSSAATATPPTSSRAANRTTMHQQMAATLEHCVHEIRSHPERSARNAATSSGPAGR